MCYPTCSDKRNRQMPIKITRYELHGKEDQIVFIKTRSCESSKAQKSIK